MSDQQSRIGELLVESDRLIRSGRYSAADELLQDVLGADPGNDNARKYLDRIQYLVKQLSQRSDLTKEVRDEIRNYSALLAARKLSQSASLLDAARKYIEAGDIKKASVDTARALALDPGNSYARALMQQLTDLQKKHAGSPDDPDNILKFRSFVWETWHKGNPSEVQRGILKGVQKQLGILDDAAIRVETELRNRLYKDALTEIWRGGGISAFSLPEVERLQTKFGVSPIDHVAVESALVRDMRKELVRATVLVVDEDSNHLLEITKQLRAHSFAIVAAAGVEEALTALETVSPDAVVSEINFQETPLGFDLFEFIRTTPATRHVPFIFITSELDRITHIIGKRLGVDEFLSKPVDYELLACTLMGKVAQRGSQKPLAPQASASDRGRFIKR